MILLFIHKYFRFSLNREPVHNVLAWWKDKEKLFPNLAALLCTPATSALSEGVFCVARQIIQAKRSALSQIEVNSLKNRDVTIGNF